jgi:hypothetical protein
MQAASAHVAVVLDKERAIALTNLARYRMASLDRPFDLSDLSKPKRSYGALVAWIWACLVPKDAADFSTPEALAEHITDERVGPLVSALMKAVTAAYDPPEKNGDGSTPKPSPSSSSVSAVASSGA